MEINPTPTMEEILAAIKRYPRQWGTRHAEIISSLNEVKASQMLLERRVTDIDVRLGAVELKISALESLQGSSGMAQPIAEAIRRESAALEARLDDYEYRSRRENLICYGIEDARTETWAETEGKVRTILKDCFSLELRVKAYRERTGLVPLLQTSFVLLLLNSPSLRSKNILSQRDKLKETSISFQEDFCKAARRSRKKLVDFGNESGQASTLRYNKLYANKKCYVYCRETDLMGGFNACNRYKSVIRENLSNRN